MRRLFLVLLAAGATACATTGATPRPFPVPNGPTVSAPAPPPESGLPVPPAPPPPPDGYEISGAALAFRGVPYRNGGSDPSGFDCSGFVWYIFDQHGVRLPRKVADQFRAGTEVDPKDLRAG